MLVLQTIIAIAQVKNLSFAFDLAVAEDSFMSADHALSYGEEADRLANFLHIATEELELRHLKDAAIKAYLRSTSISILAEEEAWLFGK